VFWHLGPEPGMAYLAGFAVEKTLALDNVFVIALIFSIFAVPRASQHRVLFWGIIGVIVLRAAMIGLGATLVNQFSWILDVFAAFLIAAGIKMLVFMNRRPDIARNPLLAILHRGLNVTKEHHGERFLVPAFSTACCARVGGQGRCRMAASQRRRIPAARDSSGRKRCPSRSRFARTADLPRGFAAQVINDPSTRPPKCGAISLPRPPSGK
jgi:hypothetical protein